MNGFTNVQLMESSQNTFSALQASKFSHELAASLLMENESYSEIEKVNMKPKIGLMHKAGGAKAAPSNTVYFYQVNSSAVDYKLP